MTDKERLEEIKQTINHPNYTEHNGQEEIYFMVSDNDFNWLIEQAERVQDLEDRISDDEHFIHEILEQNKRYREALEEIRNYGTFELNNALKTGYAWIAHEALEESK